MKRWLTAIACLTISTIGIHAQAPTAGGREPDARLFTVFSGVVESLDGDAAARGQLGATGGGFGFGFGALIFRYFSPSVDFSIARHSDRNPFTQRTIFLTERSGAFVGQLSGQVGVWAPGVPLSSTKQLVFGANFGYGKVLGDREIPNCIECRTETFSLAGGPFVEPFALLRIGDDMAVSVAYRRFSETAALRNTFAVRLTAFVYP